MTKEKKKVFRGAKSKQDFEKDPPRCQTCTYRIKTTLPVKGIGYPLHYCRIGKFAVKLFSICNEWKSYTGETLVK